MQIKSRIPCMNNGVKISLYTFLFILVSPYLKCVANMDRLELDSLADWIFLIESIIYIAGIANTYHSFFLALMTATINDQINLVCELKSRIDRCVSENERKFVMIESALNCQVNIIDTDLRSGLTKVKMAQKRLTTNQIEELSAEMRNDFLCVLIHYKIFTRQFEPLRDQLGVLISGYLIILGCVPILNSLHLVYYNPTTMTIVAYGLAVLVCLAELFLIPVCNLHTRCLGLYRSLSQLMSHIDDLEKNHKYLSGQIYDRHGIQSLRRELEVEHIVDWFAISTFGVKFTSTTLLKLHFWSALFLTLLVFSKDTSKLGRSLMELS